MNILFFLTPKAECAYLYSDYTIRQSMERMENSGYSAIPILDRNGGYRGVLTEGELLWAAKELCAMDLKQTELHDVMEIPRRRESKAISVSTNIEDLLTTATDQNFVPVVDDKGDFIGIVTRRAIMQYFVKQYREKCSK